MRRLFANANYDFISRRRTAYLLSGAAILLSLAFSVMYQVTKGSWANYGVDFVGGSLIQVRIVGAPSEAEVRGIASGAVPGSTVGSFGDSDEYNIRTPRAAGDVATGPADAVLGALRARYGEQNVERLLVEEVGAKVGGELQTRALIAVLISFAAILLYLAFRFEWRFGVAAVIATGHDILLTLGILAIFRMEISLPTVAAVLTILGYSLNDKIVVFDRIRENLRSARRPDFLTMLNRSINETLPRTVLTSVTTVVTLLSLYIFSGTPHIRELALILMVGIILGTYSSIFIASPALYEIERRFPHEQATAKRPRPAARPSRV